MCIRPAAANLDPCHSYTMLRVIWVEVVRLGKGCGWIKHYVRCHPHARQREPRPDHRHVATNRCVRLVVRAGKVGGAIAGEYSSVLAVRLLPR